MKTNSQPCAILWWVSPNTPLWFYTSLVNAIVVYSKSGRIDKQLVQKSLYDCGSFQMKTGRQWFDSECRETCTKAGGLGWFPLLLCLVLPSSCWSHTIPAVIPFGKGWGWFWETAVLQREAFVRLTVATCIFQSDLQSIENCWEIIQS